MLKKFKSKSKENDLFNNDENVSLPQKGLSTSTLISECVTDFSSQYGSETSISYTASNLAGKSNIYPNYGDFTQACVFRIYGPWWDILPSSRAPFYRTPSTFHSQDYIELSFHKKLYPLKITIYETYNPGCVVRILACETSQDTDVDTGLKHTRWKTLWEGEPEKPYLASRKFCPPLRPCHFPTNLIRLEMCHHEAYYYTELDCVELTGTTENPYKDSTDEEDEWDLLRNMDSLSVNDSTTREVNNSQEQQLCDTLQLGEITSDTDMLLREIIPTNQAQFDECNGAHSGDSQYADNSESDNGYFDLLPEEVIQLILSFLDVLSLCRVARTCSQGGDAAVLITSSESSHFLPTRLKKNILDQTRLFWKHSYDSLQYTELNLQPHWTQVNDIALDSLQSRGRFLQRLNLSWCHGNILSDRAFLRYIKTCGAGLRDLYLSSCNFLQSESICDIVENCPNLVELDIGSCRQLESEDLKHLENLKHLQRLNLYRTMVNTETITKIIRSCPELRHLNLGSCIRINDYDLVLKELGDHCPDLESLDLWRARTVSHIGVVSLAEGCPNLLELDIGWCNEVKSGSNCIIDLVENCPKLKKLFLTANRTVCDADLFAIAEHSHDLEQLDILGTRQVTAHAAQNVMRKCPKLCFFDVSFCSGIDQYMVQIWKEEFPNVAVKRSFQN